MRSNIALSVALCASVLHLTTVAVAEDSDSLFKTKADLQDQRVLLKLKKQLQDDEKALGLQDDQDHGPPKPQEQHKVQAVPVPVLTEIVGSNGHFIAVFRLSDGASFRAEPHQKVPGFGEIRAITGTAIENDHGRWISVTRGDDE